jgi:hypothetical protein
VLIGAGYLFLAGQGALDLVVREAVARSGGALEIDGATGSLLDTVRIRRITWRGPDTHASAHDVALTWNPAALMSRGLVVRGLGAQLLTLETNAATGDVPMPASMALPLEVRIERVGVAQLDWRVGENRGTMRGIAFGYAGGAKEHRVTDATFVAALGAIAGNATLGAGAPFPIAGRLKAKGDAALAGTEADIVLEGSLAGLALDATGHRAERAIHRPRVARTARRGVIARSGARLHSGVDLAAWNGRLPATDLKLVMRASPRTAHLPARSKPPMQRSAASTRDERRSPPFRLASRGATTCWRSTRSRPRSKAAARSTDRDRFRSALPVPPGRGRSSSATSTCAGSMRL